MGTQKASALGQQGDEDRDVATETLEISKSGGRGDLY